MDNKTTGAFISARRKELQLNQKQLAEKLDVTDKAVSKWETGRSAPDIALLEPLARELGVSVVEILQGEKIKEENFPAVSDEVVVTTMKKDRKKLKRAVALTIGVILSLALLVMLLNRQNPNQIRKKKSQLSQPIQFQVLLAAP